MRLGRHDGRRAQSFRSTDVAGGEFPARSRSADDARRERRHESARGRQADLGRHLRRRHFALRRARRFENIRPGPEDGLHLTSARVTALARDRLGHVWIGTDGGGLNVWDAKTRRLYYYKRDAKRLDSLSADTIYSLLVDDAGGVW